MKLKLLNYRFDFVDLMYALHSGDSRDGLLLMLSESKDTLALYSEDFCNCRIWETMGSRLPPPILPGSRNHATFRVASSRPKNTSAGGVVQKFRGTEVHAPGFLKLVFQEDLKI
jgi:hypothetical protein